VRVAIVTRIYAPEPAAAAFALRALAERLRDRGHHVTVVTTAVPSTMTIDDEPGIDVRRARVIRNRHGYVRGYLQYLSFDLPLALRLLFSHAHDIYVVEPPPTTGAVTRLVLGLRRRRYLYDAADLWSDAVAMETDSRFVRGSLRWVERFALRGAAAVVTISDGVANRIRELDIDTPVVVTGFGADANSFRPTGVSSSGPRPEFIYAGSYSPIHGAEVFVSAFAAFSKTHPGYVLRFIGNGTERGRLEAMAAALEVDRISFEPLVAPRDLAPILASATATLASVRPGTGYEYAFATKAYSSLASGTPVIFSGDGPTSELIDSLSDDGLRGGVATAWDANAVAEAMRAIADAPSTASERAELAAAVNRDYSLVAVADRIAAVIESVATAR